MVGIRNRWLSPALWAVLLLAMASAGCQVECRWLEGGSPVQKAGSTAFTPRERHPGERPSVLPVSHGQPDDAQLPSPRSLPGSNEMPPPGAPTNPNLPPNYSVPFGTPGCPVPGEVTGHVPPDLPMPSEKAKTAHPAYIIEPPDILLIQPIRLIPKPPYLVEPLDVLQIQVAEALPNQPINGPFVVAPEGVVNLGYGYGVVRVAGLTIEQAAEAIRLQLKRSINAPQVSVTLLQFRGVQQVMGEHLVGQDGTVTLGNYGCVFVTGMTICQAKAAIERHLSRWLLNPEISLSVNAYNSKVYYVIYDGAGFGQAVQRLPITGNETVLDAIALNGGLQAVSSKRRIWVARPGPCNSPCYQILPVNWEAIVMGGETCTNYQLFPGDRVFVSSDPFLAVDGALAKIFAPVERVLGITLLGASTYQTLQGNNFGGNNNN